MIKNNTPYLGKLKLKFEKNPHYSGSSRLNKVHLDLGFTKLTSRIHSSATKEGFGFTPNPEKTALIKRYTGGVIGTHSFEGGTLENSFLSRNGEYIGDLETAWWYYKNNMVVCDDYPHGVAIKLKADNYFTKYERYFHVEDLSSTDIEGYYGYTHRGSNLFKLNDRLFDADYQPMEDDYEDWQWWGWVDAYKDVLLKADEFDTVWLMHGGIATVIPYNMRGQKVIENWEEAKQAAINLSKDLS